MPNRTRVNCRFCGSFLKCDCKKIIKKFIREDISTEMFKMNIALIHNIRKQTTKEIINFIKETHYIAGEEEIKSMIEIYRVLLIKELEKRFLK